MSFYASSNAGANWRANRDANWRANNVADHVADRGANCGADVFANQGADARANGRLFVRQHDVANISGGYAQLLRRRYVRYCV